MSKLSSEIQRAALRVTDPDGNKLRLGCNCWYAFLCASLRLLRKGGGLAFVLPASFEFADYAEPLRRILPRRFCHVAVHRSSEPVFETVQEGTIVLLAHGYQESSSMTARFEYANLPELLRGLRKRPVSPRSPPQLSTTAHTHLGNRLADSVELGEVLEVGLGCVTGDSRFFLLSEEERKRKGLPISACRPVLAKARHLIAAHIDRAGWQRLGEVGERVWLFHPPDRLLEHPAVQDYLREGAAGGCRIDGYKVSRRVLWHRTQLPKCPDGFLSGMSALGPWIAFRGMPALTATNTLYTVRFRQDCSRQEKAAWALGLLTSRVREQTRAIARIYAQGLRKLEPGDVERLVIPRPRRLRGVWGVYGRAVNALLTDGLAAAQGIADEFFGGDRANG
jgi:hypothetical protein